jgi:hypothetical protein
MAPAFSLVQRRHKAKAKSHLHDICMAETLGDAGNAFDFCRTLPYRAKETFKSPRTPAYVAAYQKLVDGDVIDAQSPPIAPSC